jgi:TonB family protein
VPGVLGEGEVDVPARPAQPLAPEYPAELRRLGVEGEVEARVVVAADGSLVAAELVAASHPDFAEATGRALRAARFVPAQLAGHPVASAVTLRVHFRLNR